MPVGPDPRARRRPPRRRARICRDAPERSGHRPVDRQGMGGRAFLFLALSARLWRFRSLRAAGPVRIGARDAHASDAAGLFRGRRQATYWSIADLILGSCTVDLHKNFGAAAHMPPIETLHARSTPAKAGSADIRLLAFEDHLRFVVTHLLVHGAWRPSGLCDVAAMVEAIPPDFDWALCLGDDEVVAGWIGATIMVAHRLLGCRLDTVPPTLRVDPPPWFERAVLREWEAPYRRAIPEHCGERARQTSWSVPSLAASPLVESRRDFDRGALAAEQPSPSG